MEKLFLVSVGIFFYTWLVDCVIAVESSYEACEPRNCGSGPNISYPFSVEDAGLDICGLPGFEIECHEKKPVYKTSRGPYIVEDISYENRSLHLVDEEVVDTTCYAPSHYFAFDGTWMKFRSTHANLQFFYGCTESFSLSLEKKLIPCKSNATHLSYVALVIKDEDLSDGDGCEEEVGVPIDLEGGYSNQTIKTIDYPELLTKGFTLIWYGDGCSKCETSGGRCGFENEQRVCFCPDRAHITDCNDAGNRGSWKLKLGIGLAALSVGLLVLVVCLMRRCSSNKYSFFWRKPNLAQQNVEDFLKIHGPLPARRYSYLDVKKMTNSFTNKIGQGGYGSVYKGKLQNGCPVAVKVLKQSKGNGEEFINEVATIVRTSHVNIVALLGFCVEGSKRALIYEFMCNGSLEKFIFKENHYQKENHQLEWGTLYLISLGIARGLEYLHRGCNTRILHFDIKPHNILLDEDFSPKISDFGLAKVCTREESIISMLEARGTIGYIAPEVFCRSFGGVSYKSDVYSFGMMVLEMIGGRKNVDIGADHTSEIYFPHWIYKRLELDDELGLKGIRNQEDNAKVRKMVTMGLWCIQTDPSNRPTMSKVIEMLEGSVDSLQVPPKPFLSSPSRLPTDSSTSLIRAWSHGSDVANT